ncbi:ribosomal protein S18 [Schaalia radingae]|uniref:Small ribosomal subunit protein bS18 n=1 Tax=Schaalia radingae TaxID=131110 RepID=A0ABY0VDF5_9ACTO|nr:ribosomal protein S18 [Schaalia radingae]
MAKPQLRNKPIKKKANPLKSAKIESIDYKDTALLRKFISDRGKIRARRVTGVSVQEQRRIAKASRTPARWLCCRTLRPVAEIHREAFSDGNNETHFDPRCRQARFSR